MSKPETTITFAVFDLSGNKIGQFVLQSDPDIVRLKGTDRLFESGFSYGADGFRYNEIAAPPEVSLVQETKDG